MRLTRVSGITTLPLCLRKLLTGCYPWGVSGAAQQLCGGNLDWNELCSEASGGGGGGSVERERAKEEEEEEEEEEGRRLFLPKYSESARKEQKKVN
jgi:hypothetical protein